MRRIITCLALLLTAGILAEEGHAQEAIRVETPAGTQHEMVLVPAGEFIMGADDGLPHEQPRHTVFLDAYHIDQYEVTVAQFRACVEAGACEEPESGGDFNWGKPGRDEHPISGVAWANADAYCQWAGLRLPTEAEWEKAARGTDGRTNPWGEGIDESKASYGNVDVSPVGSFPDGASPYGAMDMAGNMWEVVADGYAGDAYLGNGLFNPVWEQESDSRIVIVRGGSSHSPTQAVRSSFRNAQPKDGTSPWGSFRCARDAEGQTSYPRFQSASAQSDGAVAGRPVAFEAEVLLSQPMEESGFSDMSVDLSPAGVDAMLELEHRGAGRYAAAGTVTVPFSGRYPLPIRVTGPDGERHLVCQVSLSVWPAADVEIFSDQLASGWAMTQRNVESVDMGQAAQVYAGSAAGAIQGKKSFAGWQVALEGAEPVESFGYALNFAFHPGELTAAPGGGVNLLEWVDVDRKEWQAVAIPMELFEMKGPMTGVSFSGTPAGAWYLDEVRLVAGGPPAPPTAVVEERGAASPTAFALQQNYPNPFNSGTVIDLALPAAADVELAVYNMAGQKVATLIDGPRSEGGYTVHWDGRDDAGLSLASGMYLYRLQAGDRVEARKLLLLR